MPAAGPQKKTISLLAEPGNPKGVLYSNRFSVFRVPDENDLIELHFESVDKSRGARVLFDLTLLHDPNVLNANIAYLKALPRTHVPPEQADPSPPHRWDRPLSDSASYYSNIIHLSYTLKRGECIFGAFTLRDWAEAQTEGIEETVRWRPVLHVYSCMAFQIELVEAILNQTQAR